MRLSTSRTAARLALAALSWALITGCASSFENQGGYDSQACVERALRRTDDLETAAIATKKFEGECNDGRGDACSALGVIYEAGAGVTPDLPRAVALYRRACNAGNQHGCGNLGIARANGFVAAGARLLEPACIGGDARSCAYLANLYLTGNTVPKNPGHAVHLLERACDGEEAAACVALGDALMKADLGDDASQFYGKGCLHGSATACRRLGGSSSGSREVAAAERR
jgi:TPR repeat protein